MGRRNRYKPDQRVDDLCHQAAETLKAIGFQFHCASLKTEACYYRWPGKTSLIRVAGHSKKKEPQALGHVAGKITFNGNVLTGPEYMRISDEKVGTLIALGIGQYFLNAKSSSGRTPGFGLGNSGSNPALAANIKEKEPAQ